ncbi:MAG: hypothetical protein Q9182_000659 [Xanthomendoza sp. 2 TL-2023]
MGLSGPRKRAKISHDPNNTAWTRSPSRFGQKLLLSQGWKPGTSLGACSGPYIDKSASISHLRVTLKDDNLGLGARNGALDDDRPTTGLDGLQDLLGRLNGKGTEMLETEQRSRADARRVVYSERRWGFENFVSGGFLVGDRIQRSEETSIEIQSPIVSVMESRPRMKHDNDTSKRDQAKRKRARESKSSGSINTTVSKDQPIKDSSTDVIENIDRLEEAKGSDIVGRHKLKEQHRFEKAERKAQRRAQKAERTATKALTESSRGPAEAVTSTVELEKKTPAITPAKHETFRSYGRHAARQRSLQHKKMSLADQKALNEVCGFANSLISTLTSTIDLDDTSLKY